MATEANHTMGEVELDVAHCLTDFTLHLTNELSTATPVDTGFARASWRPTSGAPGPEVPENPHNSGDPIAAAVNQEVRQRAAKAAFAALPRVNDKFITNNADYILELNDGKSPQAPSGYVQGVIDANTD